MYYVYLFLFTFMLPLLLTVTPYFLFQKRYTKNSIVTLFVVSIFPFVLYRIVCPVYNGPIYTQLSENREPTYNSVVRPWGDTFKCQPKEILFPKNIMEVQNIVNVSEHVRVVGAGHSFSPLVCTNDTLISLKKMDLLKSIDNTTVTVEAGISIEALQLRLLKENKIVYGFGSIQDQNVAGAFMTSHHGLQHHSFAENVIEAVVVDANGNLKRVKDLFMHRASMGMLGVVVEMTINTFPNRYVHLEQTKMPLEEAIKKLQTGFAGIIETNYNQKKHAYLKLMKKGDIIVEAESAEYPVQTDNWSSALWDTFVVPLTVLWPWLSTFPLLDFAGDTTSVKPVTNAWSHHSEYGMMYSAYAVPIENCSKVIFAMDSKPYNHHVSTLLIRFLKGQENTTCLTFAPKDSCVIDVYDVQTQPNLKQFHLYLENLVHDHGGYSHWGKFYVGNLKKQTSMNCMLDFKKVQKSVDMKGKFVNAYAREILFAEDALRYGDTFKEYRTKTVVYQVAFAMCFVIYIYTCVFKIEKNVYMRLS